VNQFTSLGGTGSLSGCITGTVDDQGQLAFGRHLGMPTDSAGMDSGRHFSGINTRIVVDFVDARFGRETLTEILDVAGETRAVSQLREDSQWSSYGQVRRLFEATSLVLGGENWLTLAATETPIDSESGAEVAQTLQDLGSPGALLRAVVGNGGTFGVSTIRLTEGQENGQREWVLRERFQEEFAPFREFCAFTVGMLAMLPRLFGLLPGEVVEESCCCDGSPYCSFRLRWKSDGDLTQERNYFETRSHLLERRLETFQRIVESIVSAPDPATGLSEILDAASRAMPAPAYILVTDTTPSMARQLLFSGVDELEAEQISRELPAQCDKEIPGRLVVEVASNRCRYGWLAAIDLGQRRFLAQERVVVRTYAGLVAASLDSKTFLEEARRQAKTSGTLLELSSSLSELTSVQEMAAHLTRAVPAVIDCDRSMVLLYQPSGSELRVVASHGYAANISKRILAVLVRRPASIDLGGDVAFYDMAETAANRRQFGFMFDEDALASASARLTANGELIGELVVSVTERPDRLRESPHLGEALRGLSAQVALAIRNARLIDQIRQQAMHDGLTGLPNRMLLLDRVDQALVRAQRDGTEIAAMFVDLDGFKTINDTLGHAVGDEVLSVIAQRLRQTLRANDTVGRLGGDEFVAVFEGSSLAAGPEVIAERILDAVRVPLLVGEAGDIPLLITASVGIAAGFRSSARELLRDADIALYQAKATDKDRWVIYHPDMSMGVRHEGEVPIKSA
jgi:diguanylate cyclase (GGDEF)-like protein